ncbi:DUF2339 domain-containing protein [Dyadobacter sp. NIV53]|uniref:DUF2339 domain-containing protein n=1 Tax=Dyadobacter sp. NIV53 TaxID=2861765 RepID=UPI001C88A839|nr:DUF2339 domain-containing protein [Dyadobacter sp. NIV53]
MDNKFDSLQNSIDSLFTELKRLEALSGQKVSPEPEKIIRPLPRMPVVEIKPAEPEIVEIPKPIAAEIPVVRIPLEIPKQITEERQPETASQVAEPEPELSFWERYPDLERFIGENLINKIGIAILVLGMGFFLKFAIDQNWINEIGRTCIGLVTGGVLIAIAHKMRDNYRSFSSVLIGGGMAILYFAITIAYQQYHLFGQELAFVIMIFITAATVFLAISYDRIELAIFAILGGFGAPFLISSGEGNYVVLFTYMLILNAGMLVLAYYKKWNLINQICFVLTVLIYGGWLTTRIINAPVTTPKPYWGALIFATLFYLIFFLMNIVNNIRKKVEFTVFEIGQLLSNTVFYFSAGMLITGAIGDGIYRGAFTIFLAVVNFTFAFILYKNDKVDRNLLYLLIGLVLTFVSLAAPIQLDGNYITLFWALESVLLVWLSYKSGLSFLRDASVLLIGLLIISLLMDWNNIYLTEPADILKQHLFPIFNKGFITSFVAVAGIAGYSILMKRYYQNDKIVILQVSQYIDILKVATIILIYFGIFHELNYQLQIHSPEIRILFLGCYNYIFAIVLLYILSGKRAEVKFVILIYALTSVIFFPILFNNETISIRNNYLLGTNLSIANFLTHYLLTVLLFVTLYSIHRIYKSLFEQYKISELFQWFVIIMVVYIASAELDHLAVTIYFSPGLPIDSVLGNNHKVGFAILWGICSFILIYLGMRWKSRTIRIASLVLFGITLLKLFIFDITGLSEGGKIAAFISLGVLLLVISFMYQKLKKILLEDELKTEAEKGQANQENLI